LANHVAEKLFLLAGIRRLCSGLRCRSEAAHRRPQIMREAIRQQAELLHQAGDAVEHGVDLAAEPVERVAGARNGNPLREIARADAVRNRSDVADALPNIMGEHQTAEESEQHCDDHGDEHRPFERVADSEALAGDATADHPFARRQAMNDDCCDPR
jgi:hypothetical protein